MTRSATHPLAGLIAAFLTLTLFVQTTSMPAAQNVPQGKAAFVAELA